MWAIVCKDNYNNFTILVYLPLSICLCRPSYYDVEFISPPLNLSLALWIALDNKTLASTTKAEAWKVLIHQSSYSFFLCWNPETTLYSKCLSSPAGDISVNSLSTASDLNEAIWDSPVLIKFPVNCCCYKWPQVRPAEGTPNKNPTKNFWLIEWISVSKWISVLSP